VLQNIVKVLAPPYIYSMIEKSKTRAAHLFHCYQHRWFCGPLTWQIMKWFI